MRAGSDSLASWEAAQADLFEAVGRVATHPGFPAASRALATAMLELFASDPVLESIFKDAGRYAAAMWGFALHDQGELTLPRLKAVGVRSGLFSPGRARALLQFLEHVGYLERHRGGGGADAYVPTPAFLAAWDRQFLGAIKAIRFIAPDIDPFLDPSQSTLRLAFGRIHAQGMLAAMPSAPMVTSFLRVFMHPYAGNAIVWTLIARGVGPDFPPHRSGPISVAGLARACGTSRVQVARIFHEAAEEGLADLGPDGFVTFHSPTREQLGFLYAVQMVQILAAAAQAASRPR